MGLLEMPLFIYIIFRSVSTTTAPDLSITRERFTTSSSVSLSLSPAYFTYPGGRPGNPVLGAIRDSTRHQASKTGLGSYVAFFRLAGAPRCLHRAVRTTMLGPMRDDDVPQVRQNRESVSCRQVAGQPPVLCLLLFL
ncbi:hypothetical protein ASPBRDRAFT_386312 [Aspergillus brasiliensis CBS 101740]|uniref:Uncharacterized protein n=1 Tax=Aspergillus brasiliensis (strain CBS 101740 / IMI 381727 / IBT 21946) TaxID=767769 RepID=A0A1L9UWC9_ASPBC|nr:hypothetical protein ASPBRDRAFT_386312 [Aspergillus brasiliensis CBS 101740]